MSEGFYVWDTSRRTAYATYRELARQLRTYWGRQSDAADSI
jgi:hypothetical protein